MNDDPREVLALLNSLGFIGITAQQLKAFMKDLKLYRKVKELERQQRKDEIRKKLMQKQENMIREIVREQKADLCSHRNSLQSNSSNFYIDDSPIKVRISRVSDEKENRPECANGNGINGRGIASVARTKSVETTAPKIGKCYEATHERDDAKSNYGGRVEEQDKFPKQPKKFVSCATSVRKFVREDLSNRERRPLEATRPTSAPNLLQHEQVGESSQAQSTSSAKHSGYSKAKSFIRPWRLQPEAQRSKRSTKSDPVTLYQKYQQEWKQMSFPGEAKHANVRWAVREKMLGVDPHPLPLPKKSNSMPLLRKK